MVVCKVQKSTKLIQSTWKVTHLHGKKQDQVHSRMMYVHLCILYKRINIYIDSKASYESWYINNIRTYDSRHSCLYPFFHFHKKFVHISNSSQVTMWFRSLIIYINPSWISTAVYTIRIPYSTLSYHPCGEGKFHFEVWECIHPFAHLLIQNILANYALWSHS